MRYLSHLTYSMPRAGEDKVGYMIRRHQTIPGQMMEEGKGESGENEGRGGEDSVLPLFRDSVLPIQGNLEL